MQISDFRFYSLSVAAQSVVMCVCRLQTPAPGAVGRTEPLRLRIEKTWPYRCVGVIKSLREARREHNPVLNIILYYII